MKRMLIVKTGFFDLNDSLQNLKSLKQFYQTQEGEGYDLVVETGVTALVEFRKYFFRNSTTTNQPTN